MHLRVLAGGPAEVVDAYRAAPFDLAVHPLRPGMAHEAVTLTLDLALGDAVERAAADEGLPTPLWAALVIESERALQALAHDVGVEEEAVEQALNLAAAESPDEPSVQRGRRLIRYALALRTPRPRSARSPCGRLKLPVPQHTFIAWESAAAAARLTVADWAAARLVRVPAGRARWESAAARAGQTLGEWIAVQAARRASV